MPPTPRAARPRLPAPLPPRAARSSTRAAASRRRARADPRRGSAPRARRAGRSPHPEARPTTRSARSTSGRMASCTRPCRTACSNHAATAGCATTAGCEISHERNSLRRSCCAARSAGRSRSDRPPTRSYSARGSIPQALSAASNVGQRDTHGRAGQNRPASRRKQQSVERKCLLRGQVADHQSAIAASTALLALVPRREDRAVERRVSGGRAQTSSSSCSSSRSTSPSHRNGIACTPKLPFSRWSW